MELNSDFGQSKQLQVRKRLSAHLSIEAQAQNSPESGNEIITLLEWANRY
jgi:hypothetical protein